MRKKYKIIFFAIGLLFIVSEGCKRESSEPQAPLKKEVQGRIFLKDEASRIIKVETEIAQLKSFSVPVKAWGKVAFNPKRLIHITSRVSGRIEKVNVFEGERVRFGQELLSLYSPDFLACQAEFIQINSRYKRLIRSSDEEGKIITGQMLASAENKLRLMGMTEEELHSLKENDEMISLLTARGPFAGTLIESNAVPGSYVEIGSPLLKIADLSNLWVAVSIYEKDLAWIKAYSSAKIQVAAFPGETFDGTLTQIGDIMDEETRTIRARVEVANPAGKLRPGMYADITLFSPTESRVLAIPERALRKVEGKNVVFIPRENNSFEIKEVEIGRAFEGFVEIIKGLMEGERVVTDGSFDLKAEMLKKTLEEEE